MRKSLILGMAALPLAGLPKVAYAGEELGGFCQMSNLTFASATIGNIAKAPPITLPVNLVCTIDHSLERSWIKLKGYRVGYCWHFHNNPRTFQYRSVKLTAAVNAPTIYYNFYGPDGKRVGGDGNFDGTSYNVLGFAKGDNGTYHISDFVTMRFENNQAAKLKPGYYQVSSTTSFHGVMTAVRPAESPNPAAPAPFCSPYSKPQGGNNISTVENTPQVIITPRINISVKTYCNIRKPPAANFGNYMTLQNVKPIIVPINVDCSAGTLYEVELNKGQHAIGNQRYMTLNGSSSANSEKIAYYVGPVSWSGVGNGTPAGTTNEVTLMVPDQPTPSPGAYKDTMVLTLQRIATPGDVFAADYDGNNPRLQRIN